MSAEASSILLSPGIPVDLPDVSNVADGVTVTIKIPVGNHSYESLHLELGGTFTTAHIKNLELRANGKPIKTWKLATDLEFAQDYHGVDTPADTLHIPLVPAFVTADQMDYGELLIGCQNLQSLQLVFDIDGATSPTLQAYAVRTVRMVNGAPNNPLGWFEKVRSFTHTAAGTDLVVSDIPREGFLMQAHLIQTTGNVTDLQVEAAGSRVWDADDTQMARLVTAWGRTRQTNVYHVDYMKQNELGRQLALEGLSEFLWRLTLSATDTVKFQMHYLSTFRGI